MKVKFFASFVFIFLLLGCSEKSKSNVVSSPLITQTPAPAPIKEFVDMPAICGIQPISIAKYNSYLQDPVYGELAKSFIEQTKELEHEKSSFGENFHAYNEDVSAGYSDLYAVDPDLNKSGTINDKTERALIVGNNSTVKIDLFRSLYSSKSGDWSPESASRVVGFTFAGYKINPTSIKSRCGLWASLFEGSQTQPPLRRFEEKYIDVQKGAFTSAPTLSIPRYLQGTSDSLFLSTTRSIHVARRFAIHPGARRPSASEAWVYVILVRNGFDHRDQSVVPGSKNGFKGEQEISVSGLIPWSDIVGYRKIVQDPHPGKGAPPEFVGPIYLRDDLERLEPVVFASIMRQLSMKSKHTEDFDNNRPWQDKKDP